MKEVLYKSYEELLLFLNAEMLVKLLGVFRVKQLRADARKGLSRDTYRLKISRSQRKITTLD